MIPMVNKTLQRHKTTIFVTTFQSKNRNDCSFKVNNKTVVVPDILVLSTFQLHRLISNNPNQ